MTIRPPVSLGMSDPNSDATCVVAQLLFMFDKLERPLALREVDKSMGRAKGAVCPDDVVYTELLKRGLNLVFISMAEVSLEHSTTKDLPGKWHASLVKKLGVGNVRTSLSKVKECAVIVPLIYAAGDRSHYLTVAYGVSRKEVMLYNPFATDEPLRVMFNGNLQRHMAPGRPIVVVSR